MTHAQESISGDESQIHPSDSIYLGVTPTYQEGMTDSGIRYKITRNEGEQLYSGRYTGSSGHDRVRIEFDPPVAAVGACCLTSAYRSLDNVPESSLTTTPVLYFEQSGYLGLTESPQGFSEVTLVTDAGPLVVNRIDIRAFPHAFSDTFTCAKNMGVAPSAQSVLFNDRVSEEALLVSKPLHAKKFELRSDGTFLYSPEEDYVGLDSFEYRSCNGGGATQSNTATVTIDVVDRNAAPTFEASGDVKCNAEDGAVVIEGWVRTAYTGASDEQDQQLRWDVQTDRPELFASQPFIDDAGNLHFEPAATASGEALLKVRLLDNGGTENGGCDTSMTQVFQISIAPVEKAPYLPAFPDTIVDPYEGLHVALASPVQAGLLAPRYELVDAPAGAWIDASTGGLCWLPSPHVAPGVYKFRLRAVEPGPRGLSSTVAFDVEILDPKSYLAQRYAKLRYALRQPATSGSASMALQSKP